MRSMGEADLADGSGKTPGAQKARFSRLSSQNARYFCSKTITALVIAFTPVRIAGSGSG